MARSLDWRVQVETAAREFYLCVGLKEDIMAYNLKHGCLLFCFQAGERDSVLSQPWMVTDQASMVEPW